MPEISFKSYCFCLGTTSFRTTNFNRTIEVQLDLLNQFWSLPEYQNQSWKENSVLQTQYYEFMKNSGFIIGEAARPDKDAREKTSGLADVGIITPERRLTEAGQALLDISKHEDFESDNFLQIPKDSYIYLKQLLKTANELGDEYVRPYIVLVKLLKELNQLSEDEFAFLYPLCTTRENTEEIIESIRALRQGQICIDDIILNRLMNMDNYQAALDLLLNNEVTEELICEIGMNRKSRKYDKPYFVLYQRLKEVFIDNDATKVADLYDATKEIKIGLYWRTLLFDTTSRVSIMRDPVGHLNNTEFTGIHDVQTLKVLFFRKLHLFKAKATLNDYRDLNTRYLKTSDTLVFNDRIIKFDIAPKAFFEIAADELFIDAFRKSTNLYSNCPINEISQSLGIQEHELLEELGNELGVEIETIGEAQQIIQDERYNRLRHLIDTRFTDNNLLRLLSDFETRNDKEIQTMVTDNADIPTIFEYILGIIWYKTSEYTGRVLDYLKLSLDADLLPRTHAAGGEADIVYEYDATNDYPKHTLLLEATLAEQSIQRKMEMEPVSRHLGQHILNTGNINSFCVFATNNLNINVISDFRGRKVMPFYDFKDPTRFITGMKIIPLETSDLKEIIIQHKNYRELYPVFQQAYESERPPHEWYQVEIKNVIHGN